MTTTSTDPAPEPAQLDPIPNPARLAHWEKKARTFPPLEDITRPVLTTREAAFYLNRAEQTLRAWAMNEDGPLQPGRIHGRLTWSTAVIRRLVGVAP